jgi:hypothetical protein
LLKKRPLKYLIAKISLVIPIVFVLFEFTNCKTHNDKYIEEGVIEYETKAVDPNHPLADLAPTEAILKFKKDRFYVELSVMGMFNTMIVADVPRKTVSQMVKFMNVKQACIETQQDIENENAAYRVLLEETHETKVIAGYNCIKVNASMVNDPRIKFDVYYTKELGVENVNELSPYKELRGMLMEYRLRKNGLELAFTAKKVKKASIPDNLFEIQGYYKIVSGQEMAEFFATLQ